METGPFSNLNVDEAALREVFRDEALVGNVEEFCAPPQGVDEDDSGMLPCSAGHTACYVSPYGDVYPCVQFPLPSGNVRRTKFVDIWRDSPQLKEVRSITLRGHALLLPVHAWRQPARAARGWRTSKEICADLLPRTAKNPTRAPEFPVENFKARNASPQPFQSLQLVQIQGN